jgi:AraC family transcriptional regulator
MKDIFLRTETRPETKLVGRKIWTSLAEDTTAELWKSFMPRRKEVTNIVSKDFYAVQMFDPNIGMDQFTPYTKFEKWAAVPVAGYDQVPHGLERLTLTGGLYAVFVYKGRSSEFARIFQYIFQTWLPSSPYVLDNRPHFEIMGEKYNNDDPDSEEEIWIPIVEK